LAWARVDAGAAQSPPTQLQCTRHQRQSTAARWLIAAAAGAPQPRSGSRGAACDTGPQIDGDGVVLRVLPAGDRAERGSGHRRRPLWWYTEYLLQRGARPALPSHVREGAGPRDATLACVDGRGREHPPTILKDAASGSRSSACPHMPRRPGLYLHLCDYHREAWQRARRCSVLARPAASSHGHCGSSSGCGPRRQLAGSGGPHCTIGSGPSPGGLLAGRGTAAARGPRHG
jgi:hypothetical protein